MNSDFLAGLKVNKKHTIIKFLLPAFILVIIISYFSLTRVDPQQQAYYVAVYCQLNKVPSTDDPVAAMGQIVEGGNADYALKRTEFDRPMAEKIVAAANQLHESQRSKLQTDNHLCIQTLTAKMDN